MPQTAHDIFNVFTSQMRLSDFHPTTKNPALAKVRIEELDGREYLVVPMVMLVVGVHRGSNGSIYYPPQELAYSPKQWNMKPIVLEHPFNGGSGTDLEIYKKQAVGQIMNSHFTDDKLKAEAWLDLEKVRKKCPEIIDHIKHGLPMEVSTGLTSDIFADNGVWQGEPYSGRIGNIRSDHLAILPKKQGACSLSDGAGLLINAAHSDSEFPKVIHTHNAEYFPGSLAADDIQAPERKPQPQEQLPTNDTLTPNPFGINTIVQGQQPSTVTGNFPTGQNEPMIPLSVVQAMIQESLQAMTAGIKAVQIDPRVSADTPLAPVVTSTVPVQVDTTPAAPAVEPPIEPVPEPTKELLASGELSEEDLSVVMPEISTLIESLYHLLTKTKNPPTPAATAVQIENPGVTPNTFNSKYTTELAKLDEAFLDPNSKITRTEYEKKCSEINAKLNEEKEARSGLHAAINNSLTALINSLPAL